MGTVSLQKLSANRKNAQLSTGPKTLLGKARSALNAVKHGIFSKECMQNGSAEARDDYEALQLGMFESLKPRNEVQAMLCDKIVIDVWRLRKVLTFEQGARQLEVLNLDTSGSPVKFSDRDVIVYKLENCRSEEKVLDQLKRCLTTKEVADLTTLSGEAYALLAKLIRNLMQRFPEVYGHIDVKLLEDCKQLSEFCNRNELDLDPFRADLLDCIEDRRRALRKIADSHEKELQDFDHKRSVYESVAQLPSAENIDKIIRYETHLQRSIERNLRLLRSLQGTGQMSFGFVW